MYSRTDVDWSVRKNFEVRASNDASFSTYTVLASQGGTDWPFKEAWVRYVNNSTAFRYVAIIKTDFQYFNINELKIYGKQ